jgi:hypothetical protein
LPIIASELELRLSGGAGNTDVNASLGGAKSSTAVTDNVLNNLWDNISGTESSAGDTEYRCVYIHNADGAITAENVRIYISTDTTSATEEVDIGLGTAAINATEQTVANESTAPSGVTFSHPTDYAGGLASANIPPGQHRSVWIRRVVDAATAAKNNNTYVMKCDVDTAE